MARRVDVDRTRQDIRDMFAKWGIDKSEYEIVWQEETLATGVKRRLPGATIHYLRDNKWQTVSCFSKWDRGTNLRQLYMFLDRIRISEKVGIQYQGLSYTTEVTKSTKATSDNERDHKEDILDAYDILGASPDDPIELIKDIYRRKCMYYHPDKGGDQERFKRLQNAYELIMLSRGQKP
jgi:DnaJ-domain-containing protein 1